MAGAGQAILFVILLVMLTISGAYILAYAARCFVLIAQQTAGGLDEVTWPSESILDWLARAVHLAWLVILWLAPVGFVLRAVRPDSGPGSVGLYVGVPAFLFWILFPITLLSSFSADSPWVLFRLEVLRRMARAPGATLAFYASTAPLCLAAGAALYATFAHTMWYVLPVAATPWFLYARLAGRFSRLLGRVRLRTARPVKARDEPKVTPPDRRKKKKTPRTGPAHDPWAVPEEEEQPEKETALPVEGYGLAGDESPRPAPEKEEMAEPVETYEVQMDEGPRRLIRERTKKDNKDRDTEEDEDSIPGVREARQMPDRGVAEAPLPARPFVTGVYSFPFYPASLPAWLLLSGVLLLWGLIYSMMQSVRPV
jgi:hypothetical protein